MKLRFGNYIAVLDVQKAGESFSSLNEGNMGKGLLQDIIIAFQENLVYVIGAALAVLFVLLLTFTPSFFEGQASFSSVSTNPRSGGVNDQVNAVINRNLREDQTLLELREAKTAAENLKHREKLNFSITADDLGSDIGMIDPNVYDGSSDVYSDIYGDEGAIYDGHLSPRERIEARITRIHMMEEYDFRQKVEFVRDFMLNAYQAGYLVKFNDQLEVIDIKEVDPTQEYRGAASLEDLGSASAR